MTENRKKAEDIVKGTVSMIVPNDCYLNLIDAIEKALDERTVEAGESIKRAFEKGIQELEKELATLRSDNQELRDILNLKDGELAASHEEIEYLKRISCTASHIDLETQLSEARAKYEALKKLEDRIGSGWALVNGEEIVKQNEHLTEQVRRYEEALKFYADKNNHDDEGRIGYHIPPSGDDPDHDFEPDYGNVAREALRNEGGAHE